SGRTARSKWLWYRPGVKGRLTGPPTRVNPRFTRRSAPRACWRHTTESALAPSPTACRHAVAVVDAGPARAGPGRAAAAGHRLLGRRAADSRPPGGIRRDDAARAAQLRLPAGRSAGGRLA